MKLGVIIISNTILSNVRTRGKAIIQNVKNVVGIKRSRRMQVGQMQIGQGQIINKIRSGIAETRTMNFGHTKQITQAEKTFAIGDGRPKSATIHLLDIAI